MTEGFSTANKVLIKQALRLLPCCRGGVRRTEGFSIVNKFIIKQALRLRHATFSLLITSLIQILGCK